MIVFWFLATVSLSVTVGFVLGVVWLALHEEDQAVRDGEQLPARGTGHVDHAAPADHRAPSRFAGPRVSSSRQVPHDSDGGRP